MSNTVSDCTARVEIWVPRFFAKSGYLDSDILALIHAIHAKGIGVVIFEAGEASLYDTTVGILKHNRGLQCTGPDAGMFAADLKEGGHVQAR